MIIKVIRVFRLNLLQLFDCFNDPFHPRYLLLPHGTFKIRAVVVRHLRLLWEQLLPLRRLVEVNVPLHSKVLRMNPRQIHHIVESLVVQVQDAVIARPKYKFPRGLPVIRDQSTTTLLHSTVDSWLA